MKHKREFEQQFEYPIVPMEEIPPGPPPASSKEQFAEAREWAKEEYNIEVSLKKFIYHV